MHLIREPAHTGGPIGFFLSARDADRPTIVIVPQPGHSFLRYMPVLSMLLLRGCGICFALLSRKKSEEEHRHHIQSIYLHLRFAEGVTQIGYVGDRMGCIILSHAKLPGSRCSVYLRPKDELGPHPNACVVHEASDLKSQNAYSKLPEPKQRIVLDHKHPLFHGITLSRCILQWLTPIPEDVRSLPDIMKGEKKE